MDTYDTVVTHYLEAWNETDPTRRRALLAQGWAEGAHYHDPLMEGVGHEAIDALIQAVHNQFPGYRFQQVGPAEGHHSYVRFAWELGPEGGPAPIAGSDIALLGPDGRIERVIGFLDRVPMES